MQPRVIMNMCIRIQQSDKFIHTLNSIGIPRKIDKIYIVATEMHQ